ncbi:TetM/TetW/TetO/TetS family tetracycline resistance ribosomal protection protein [Paenibacillus sp.]|jgi:ribosomal protection tetracycline resistance protein|uniref:TetM/TetW/TetO/TetS family tetracycline resistance ribosomal protection protein n=1 Tax=Paenibacillus sp. TaxID=58172 RepID=UPI002839D357|nr:TetM/TetW/TetO/TetS family tetracycline resistance ribosomal protection protein [Paenibacillus sp.]MDR0270500.1 TetM/TetW/TetO/TetS family tetracycline resistance ribosomal protection protein [Paenibacillus sp.]
MKIINIGILAHVDAGKTSLAERILFDTNVIDELGRVDQGNTQMDAMDLERKRGITIKASVVSFNLGDYKVNLIDTPGHADFIAEVERSLSVLDGVILVISAVEGVQAQTKILFSVLRKMGIPTILFVNKIDRLGARSEQSVEQIRAKLAPSVVSLCKITNAGLKEASVSLKRFDWDTDSAFLEQCIELLSSYDESLLESYIHGEMLPGERVEAAFRDQVRQVNAHPVYFGSAVTGVGVADLLAGITRWFPVNETQPDETFLSGIVFKLEREASGEKIAYIRLFSGSLSLREQVKVGRNNKQGEYEIYDCKIKKLHALMNGKSVPAAKIGAGDLAKVWGLEDVRIGDIVGESSNQIKRFSFAVPRMETKIEAADPSQTHHLYQALVSMSEEDPLIQVVKNEIHQDLYIRIFGEVQKEVIESALKETYSVAVRFAETRTVCVEKPAGVGQALEVIMEGDNPFYATVGFRIEPGGPGSGITYRLEVELGSLPLAFHKAIEETVHLTLLQGLFGWEVTDIIVTLTHTGYASPVTTAGDFRKLVPLVFMEALVQAGTEVYEPIYSYVLTVPKEAMSKAVFKLSAIQAIISETDVEHGMAHISGTIPVSMTESFKRSLHAFTQGEGFMMTEPAGFIQVHSDVPTRPRTDYNPLQRNEYLMHVMRAF